MLIKNTNFFYLKKSLRSLSLVVIPVVMIYFAFRVLAGNLAPGLPTAATMRTLEEIYSVLAGTSYVSPTVTPSINGNALQVLKCITNRMDTGVGWYKTGGAWLYRRAITIDKDQVSNTDQTNFPVLVNITAADLKDMAQASPGHVGKSNGGDIFFTSSNGTTKLSHEIEKYNGVTGNLIAWVKVPTVSASADTVIYLYYGNAASADQWDTANVWDFNYKMVQHLSDATTSTTADSTSNANDSTKLAANEPIETPSGQINKAQSFDGGNDYVNAGNSNSLELSANNALTVEGWFNIPEYFNASGTNREMIDKRNKAAYYQDGIKGWNIWHKTIQGYFMFTIGDGTNVEHKEWNFDDMSSYNNQWAHIVWTVDSSGYIKSYFNGVLEDTQQFTTVNFANTNGGYDLLIGDGFSDFGDNYLGSIDEIRISSSARSADWIATEYNNQFFPSTFYNLGSEEDFGC